MTRKSQSGIAHLYLLLFFLVVAVIGVVGWRVMQKQNDQTGDFVSSNTSSVPAKVAAPDSINNSADLNKTAAALNQTNIDRDVNPDSLNADLNSLQ
jgi:predicted negative regulator of RcsB-dependent stress response